VLNNQQKKIRVNWYCYAL